VRPWRSLIPEAGQDQALTGDKAVDMAGAGLRSANDVAIGAIMHRTVSLCPEFSADEYELKFE
jgi:hypothetical protein